MPQRLPRQKNLINASTRKPKIPRLRCSRSCSEPTVPRLSSIPFHQDTLHIPLQPFLISLVQRTGRGSNFHAAYSPNPPIQSRPLILSIFELAKAPLSINVIARPAIRSPHRILLTISAARVCTSVDLDACLTLPRRSRKKILLASREPIKMVNLASLLVIMMSSNRG